MKKVLLFLILILIPHIYASPSINFLTKGFGDTLYCQMNGDCTLMNLLVLGNVTFEGDFFNVSVTNYNVTGEVNAYGYLENGTNLYDIFVNDEGDTMKGPLNHSTFNTTHGEDSVIMLDVKDGVLGTNGSKISFVSNDGTERGYIRYNYFATGQILGLDIYAYQNMNFYAGSGGDFKFHNGRLHLFDNQLFGFGDGTPGGNADIEFEYSLDENALLIDPHGVTPADIIVDNSSLGSSFIVGRKFIQNASNGRMGIGTMNPSAMLEVSDDIEADNITLSGSPSVIGNSFVRSGELATGLFYSTQGIELKILGASFIKMTDPILGTAATVFNDGGGIQFFRVEGSSDPNLITANPNTDRVGIGTSTPVSKLQVYGIVTIGDGREQVNMTLTSPDAREWCCGVDNSGTFSCSLGACP